jgi:MFS family permease
MLPFSKTMPMNYFSFMRAHYRFLLFGFLMMGLSNFGQTFFIALYSNEIRALFDLSNAGFGGLYSAMTLLSAAVMVYSGRFIDAWSLRRFTLFVLGGLALGCLVMASAPHIFALALALFLLRHFGQGLSSHTGMTTAGRSFDSNRGQAVSLVQLGYASFEGFFPLMAVALMALIGWQQSWFVFAAILLLLAVPVQLYLSAAEPKPMAEEAQGDNEAASADRSDVLRDRRFYMVMPLYLAPPFFLTGLFFHQVQLAESRDWPIAALAAAFTLYAFAKVTVSLLTGPTIDRLSALRLMPLTAVPLVLAFSLLLVPYDVFGSWTPFIYMGLIGINLGMAGPISGGLWPELFGTAHLGAIRSLTSPIVISATAAAPVLFGAAIDMGVGFSTLAGGAVVFIIASALLAFSVPADKLATK